MKCHTPFGKPICMCPSEISFNYLQSEILYMIKEGKKVELESIDDMSGYGCHENIGRVNLINSIISVASEPELKDFCMDKVDPDVLNELTVLYGFLLALAGYDPEGKIPLNRFICCFDSDRLERYVVDTISKIEQETEVEKIKAYLCQFRTLLEDRNMLERIWKDNFEDSYIFYCKLVNAFFYRFNTKVYPCYFMDYLRLYIDNEKNSNNFWKRADEIRQSINNLTAELTVRSELDKLDNIDFHKELYEYESADSATCVISYVSKLKNAFS